MTMSSSRKSLSVVVATTLPWPGSKTCLDRLCPQIRALDAEIILADSSGSGLPSSVPEPYADVQWLNAPGVSVFELRARATAVARGDIIAWTEDHCVPASDWCERILAAHAEQPKASAIGGAVVNGSTTCLIDWANFLVTFGPFLPPVETRKIRRAPPAANVSFKRRAIPVGKLESGWVELVLGPRLFVDGMVAIDPRIQVAHVQSHGLLGTFVTHFHNGRSTTGLISPKMSASRRMARLLLYLGMPAAVLHASLAPLWNRPRFRGRVFASLPFMAMLACCHSAGSMLALLVNGPGRSPERLR